jgi:hypothetical protein
MHITKVLLQLGQDGVAIISSAYPSLGFGGRIAMIEPKDNFKIYAAFFE